jgi:chromatin remodeling complex protein RSC6
MASAISKAVELSPELADFMGSAKASRGDVTKAIWKYIRDEDLALPNGGYKFDETLSRVLHSKGMKKASELFSLLKKADAFPS